MSLDDEIAAMQERLGPKARRTAALAAVLLLRRNGAVITYGRMLDGMAMGMGRELSFDAVKKAISTARRLMADLGWPVTVRGEAGTGWRVSWPRGWTMPQAGGNAMPCAEDTSPFSSAPAGATAPS